MRQKNTKVSKITDYLRQNPTANKEQVERGIGFKFSSSQLAVARKRLGINMRSGDAPASLFNDVPLDEQGMRRQLALDMIQQNLSSINRLLMELR